MNHNEITSMAREAGLFVPRAGLPENGALIRFFHAAYAAGMGMTTLRTAAQQALEYMKSVGKMDMHPEEWAIVGRLEAALAEPVQEPGSLMIAAQQFLEWNRSQTPPRVEIGFELGVFEAAMKTYTSPPQRKEDT